MGRPARNCDTDGMDANPQEPPAPTVDGPASPDTGPNGPGTIAGIAGVVGLLLFPFFTRGVGLTVAIGAMLLGFVARSQARSRCLRTGMANVGIISGISICALYPLTLYLETIWPV